LLARLELRLSSARAIETWQTLQDQVNVYRAGLALMATQFYSYYNTL
jgi:hypothetical protein